MTPTAIISMAGVLCAIGVAMLGVVWRLGSKTGEMGLRILAFEAALRLADAAAEKWNGQVLAAIREFDTKVNDLSMKYADLENKWRVAHRLAQKVTSIDNRVCGIEAVCRDRIRCEISQPLFPVEDAAPRLRDDDEEKT